jgi:hypothetical protein
VFLTSTKYFGSSDHVELNLKGQGGFNGLGANLK